MILVFETAAIPRSSGDEKSETERRGEERRASLIRCTKVSQRGGRRGFVPRLRRAVYAKFPSRREFWRSQFAIHYKRRVYRPVYIGHCREKQNHRGSLTRMICGSYDYVLLPLASSNAEINIIRMSCSFRRVVTESILVVTIILRYDSFSNHIASIIPRIYSITDVIYFVTSRLTVQVVTGASLFIPIA